MFLVEESTIPSALVTKENLMLSQTKTKKNQNRALFAKGQIERSSALGVCGGNTGRASVDRERATPFLPPIAYVIPKTRGETPWKWQVGTEGRATKSVLSLRGDGKRSRNNNSRLRTIDSLQKSVIPQAKTSVPQQRRHRALKFWKGSRQHSRRGKRKWSKVDKTDTSNNKERSMENESSDDNLGWSQNIAYLEEIDKNETGFYARQLALRERLIEFEAMHYREAVTRINRYREKLRRPLQSRSRAATQKQKERKRATQETNLLKVEGDSENFNEGEEPASDPMFRLSPDKEWKPNVQQKIMFNGKFKNTKESKPPVMKRKEQEESHIDKSRKQQQQLGLPKGIPNSRSSPTNTQPTKADSRNEPASSMSTKDDLGITAVGLAHVRQIQTSSHPKRNFSERKANAPEESPGAKSTHPIPSFEERPNTKSSLSSKLRLLLNNSAKSKHEQSENQQTRQKGPEKKKSRSYFRNSVSRYQLSNDDRFPSITRIGSLTTAKGRDGEQKFVMRGISDDSARTRLSTSLSSRIIERIKQRSKNESQAGVANRPKTQNPSSSFEKQLPDLTDSHTRTLTLPIPQTAGGTTINGVSILGATAQQAPPRTEFQSKAAASEVIKKSRSLQRAMKSHRKALKQQKVLRVAFVENANEAEKRQSEIQELRAKEVMGKHMLADPKQLAITSLTAAILNSEVLLRAPSSSPVDFLKGHHVFHPKKNKETSTDNLRYGEQTSQHSSVYAQEKHATINATDGLSPVHRPFEYLRSVHAETFMPSVSDLVDVNGLYEAMRMNRQPGLKATNSTLGSLQILQRQHLDRILLKKQPLYYNPFHNQKTHVLAPEPAVPLYVVTAAKAVHKPSEKQTTLRPNPGQKQSRTGMERGTFERKIFHSTPFPEYGKDKRTAVVEDHETVGYSGIRGVTVSTAVQPIPVIADKGH